MPGIVAFRRRWSVGSDDLVVPGVFLLTIHIIWIIILAVILAIFQYDKEIQCIELLWLYKLGYIAILVVSSCIELAICIVSMRGSILDTGPRASMHYWLYIKLVVILIDIAWLVVGIVWLKEFYIDCSIGEAKEIMLGLVICNWMVNITILITIWCTFDTAGRSWVKMKKYQRSMRESESRFNYKRSGSRNRNWRQRKVIRAYQDSWDHRCRLLFCCMGSSERNRNSFADIARLLSDFFRDLDVVPSDVVAGLVLLRKFQILKREAIVRQKTNGTYEFLSGVPITERTQFLALNDQHDYDLFQNVIHYMHYAHGAYGWPMFLITHSTTGLCQLCSELRCCLSCCGRKETAEVVKDNCCYCNYAALKKMLKFGEVEIIYATYHVDVGETPFFVAVDYAKRKVVVSIRGTLSMKDVLTDLNAEGECLPLDPPREDWLGHKGMVQAAVYIKNKLEEENLIQRGLTHNPARNTQNFGLVLLGHSLGAGTAAILAILLKPQYPSLVCYSYSPPGGLLSMPAVEYSKSFITSVVVGKDVVPRIGLHQMETLRADLINAIKQSIDPKWKTITCSVICCGCGPEPTSVSLMSSQDANINNYEAQRNSARQLSHHPNDSSIALTLHHPLFPPGRIIHIVRHHPTPKDQMLKKKEPVYQAIWAENTDFEEVLISPVMLQDHMPDKVLAALNKVITTFGPRKPHRQASNANSSITSDIGDLMSLDHRAHSPTSLPIIHTTNNFTSNNNSTASPPAPHKICLETSFTSLQSPMDPLCGGILDGSSKGSSIAGSLFGKSQLSSILQYDVSSLHDDSTLGARNSSLSGPTGSEATTVVLVSEQAGVSGKPCKNVAFDVDCITPFTMMSTSPSPFPTNLSPAHPYNAISPSGVGGVAVAGATNTCLIPKSILHKQPQFVMRPFETMQRRPVSLSMTNVPNMKAKKCDLIHDDWFGLAPLASPESLSEISSISSRTSNAINLAASIEKCLQRLSSSNPNAAVEGEIIEIDESQLCTPKILRRAPKITGNLSTCADDWKNVDSYKRMGQIFIAGAGNEIVSLSVVPSINNFNRTGSLSNRSNNTNNNNTNSNSNNNSDSSDLSYETASSMMDRNLNSNQLANMNLNSHHQSGNIDLWMLQENSKSADNLDAANDDDVGNDNNLNNLKFIAISDSRILDNNSANYSECPNCPCHNRVQFHPQTILCCQYSDHRRCRSSLKSNATNTTSSSGDTYFSAMSSLTGGVGGYSGFDSGSFPNSIVDNNNSSGNNSNSSSTKTNKNQSTIYNLKPGVLESHFPVYYPISCNDDKLSLLPSSSSLSNANNNSNNPPKRISFSTSSGSTSNISKKRNNSDDVIMSKNESLPLLINLNETKQLGGGGGGSGGNSGGGSFVSSSSPTSFVKRKRNIYPMNAGGNISMAQSFLATSPTRKGESNV